MTITGQELKTHFAPPQRESMDIVRRLAADLLKEPMLDWIEAVPMPLVVINEYRQILFCNDIFQKLTLAQKREDVLGLRPGEALSCVNATAMAAGCGCSVDCDSCGAAHAIIKSLDGNADCQECRMIRSIDQQEVPLDLQVFTQPVEYRGSTLSLLFAMDISHEMRLRYLNRTFYHGLINSVGGIATLTELIEAQEDTQLFPVLIDSARRTLTDVLYHRDLAAAENHRLRAEPEWFEAHPYLERLIETQCAFYNIQPSSVELTADEGLSLFADKRLLGHVLRNMLTNALEAEGGQGKQIRMACVKDGDTVVLSLENPGLVPENIRRQMFKRYVSSKSRNRGMGTYVIKLLTENYLDGEVSFQTGDGWTRFTVAIPASGRSTH